MLFRECDADLGLSLGCGYIPKSVFGIPKRGMINIHMEVLPRFQGAYSIIWPIYEGISETGFTIHQIDSNIDTGAILYQEKYPITFFPKMKETIQRNLDQTRSRIPNAIAHVCENYDKLQANAVFQAKGKGYTTPSIWNYFRMLRNHRAMYKQTLLNGGQSDD